MLVRSRARVGPGSLRVSSRTVAPRVFCWLFHWGQFLKVLPGSPIRRSGKKKLVYIYHSHVQQWPNTKTMERTNKTQNQHSTARKQKSKVT